MALCVSEWRRREPYFMNRSLAFNRDSDSAILCAGIPGQAGNSGFNGFLWPAFVETASPNGDSFGRSQPRASYPLDRPPQSLKRGIGLGRRRQIAHQTR